MSISRPLVTHHQHLKLSQDEDCGATQFKDEDYQAEAERRVELEGAKLSFEGTHIAEYVSAVTEVLERS